MALEVKCQENARAIAQQIKSSGASTASDVTYDNTASGLTADNVQEAIDELASRGVAYSTTEKVIGKWIDDSDVYQTVFALDPALSLVGTGTDLPDAIQTALAVVDRMISAYALSATACVPIGLEYASSKWTAYCPETWSDVDLLIITYTKTVI